MLDERLALAASLYEPCEWGADIGTDHAYLPCHLLTSGICRHMIAADVSPGALGHARASLTRAGLADRAEIVLADGLEALTRPCGCVSIMGMGGENMADILRKGRDRLHGAVLVLSAHTDQPMVRRCLAEIGYVIVQERLCHAAGRYYVIWRAEQGPSASSEAEIRYGRLLWKEPAALLTGYVQHRLQVLIGILRGHEAAASPDQKAIRELKEDIGFYQHKLEVLSC